MEKRLETIETPLGPGDLGIQRRAGATGTAAAAARTTRRITRPDLTTPLPALTGLIPAPGGPGSPATRGGRGGPAPPPCEGGPASLRRLPEPVRLRGARRGDAYVLVAADSVGGVLTSVPGGEPPAANTRLVLRDADGVFGAVTFIAHVLGTLGSPYDGGLAVRWIAVTAARRRRELVAALRSVLGLRARVCVADDALGPHQKLVYNPERRQVRIVTVGQDALPRGGGRATRPSLAAVPDPGQQAASSSEPSPGSAPVPTMTAAGLRQPTPPPDVVGVIIEAPLALAGAAQQTAPAAPPELGPTALPQRLVQRSRADGVFTFDGAMRPMACAWIGPTHVSFTAAVDALPVGIAVEVGVPASPLAAGVIWVTGTVSLVTRDERRDQLLIEVDLRRWKHADEAAYQRLVAHWAAA